MSYLHARRLVAVLLCESRTAFNLYAEAIAVDINFWLLIFVVEIFPCGQNAPPSGA